MSVSIHILHVIYKYIYTYIHTYTHIYIYTQTHTYIYIYNIYIYTQKKKKLKKKRIQYKFFCPISISTKLNTQKFCYINETTINCWLSSMIEEYVRSQKISKMELLVTVLKKKKAMLFNWSYKGLHLRLHRHPR